MRPSMPVGLHPEMADKYDKKLARDSALCHIDPREEPMNILFKKCWGIGFVISFLSCGVAAQPPIDGLVARMELWRSKALLCDAGPQVHKFPTKQTMEPRQPCDDGDMTLFNGLLCAAGNKLGCDGVADAQDPTSGEWFRSPRIRLIGNDRGGASFSPDMALGVQLYLISTRDTARAQKWFGWLHELVPCSVQLGTSCLLRGIPRFCSPEQGCTMRPGDAAVLAQTVSFLQKQAALPALPDGRLRGYISSFSDMAATLNELDANVNRAGYSQHLVAVSILALRLAGLTDSKLQSSAAKLATREPGNAFFAYLSEGGSPKVFAQVLDRCPRANTVLVPPLRQWQWEREDADRAWESSAYWDCIFMGHMLLSK